MTTIPALSRAAIIHGYAAAPDDHWFPWLAARLRADGVRVDLPALPEPGAPDRDRWARTIAGAIGEPDRGTAVVAHSLGCLAALRHLLALPGPWRLGSLVLVSGFLDRLPALPGLDAFIGAGAEPASLRGRVDRLTVIRSDGDPFVPIGHTDRLARLLEVEPVIVAGAGHFLASEGSTTLPEALDALSSPRGDRLHR